MISIFDCLSRGEGHSSCVAIRIRVDFDAYYNANSEEKVRLAKEMILKAIKKVKSKGKFDYD